MSAVTYSILLYFQYLALVIFIMKLRFFARDSSDILHKFPWGRPFWARVGFWEMTDKHSRDEFLDVFSDQIREYRNEIRIGMSVTQVHVSSPHAHGPRSWWPRIHNRDLNRNVWCIFHKYTCLAHSQCPRSWEIISISLNKHLNLVYNIITIMIFMRTW